MAKLSVVNPTKDMQDHRSWASLMAAAWFLFVGPLSADNRLSLRVYPQTDCHYVLVIYIGEPYRHHTLQESCDGGKSWSDVCSSVWSWDGHCTWGLWERCPSKWYRVKTTSLVPRVTSVESVGTNLLAP